MLNSVDTYFYFMSERAIGVEVAKTVSMLMRKVKRKQWTQLYQTFYSLRISRLEIALWATYPADIAVELLGIASLNCSGYVREAAVKRLRALSHPRALPYLMLRLADWVVQVRKLAEEFVIGYIDKVRVKELIAYSYLIGWMEKVERVDLSPIYQAIMELLGAAVHREVLLESLEDAEPEVRLFCYIVLKEELEGHPEIIDRGLKDRELKIRWWMKQAIVDSKDLAIRSKVVCLLYNPAPRIRTSAIMSIPEHLEVEVADRIEDMLFDDSASVRSTARFYLERKGYTDFDQRYRQQLKREKMVRPGAIMGLAETGGIEDFGIIKAYVRHQLVKIRVAALTGMERLNSVAVVGLAMVALDDESAKVRRAGGKVLQRHLNRSVIDALREKLATSSLVTKRTVFAVLIQQSGWGLLSDILLAAMQEEKKLQEDIRGAFDKWRNHWADRLWIKPTEAELVLIEERMRTVRQKDISVPKGFWKVVESAVDYVRK